VALVVNAFRLMGAVFLLGHRVGGRFGQASELGMVPKGKRRTRPVLQQCSLRWRRRLVPFKHPFKLAYRDAQAASNSDDWDLTSSCSRIARVLGKTEISPARMRHADRFC
jgi:hypothetical protein